jgi:hypothetical protein
MNTTTKNANAVMSSAEAKVFLAEYRIALINFRKGNQEIEDKDRRRELDDEFKLQWAEKAQEKGYIPPHDMYVEWDQLLTNLSYDKESAKKIRKIRKFAKIEELFEFREILGKEDISPSLKYFEKEKLQEKAGSDEAMYGYILGIWRAVKRIENEEERKKILRDLAKKGSFQAFNEKKMDHLIRKLNSEME